jgi:hypothetical protein
MTYERVMNHPYIKLEPDYDNISPLDDNFETVGGLSINSYSFCDILDISQSPIRLAHREDAFYRTATYYIFRKTIEEYL